MKIRLLIFIALLFSPALLIAQKAPKNVKVIKLNVGNDKTKDQLYVEVSQFLIDKGYEIGKSDKELGLIQTEDRTISYWKSRLSVTVSDGTITFRGKAIGEMPGMGSSIVKDIENKGSMGSMYVKTWKDMDEVARSFPHNSVEYSN